MKGYENLTPIKQALIIVVLYILLVGLFTLFPSPSADSSSIVPWTIYAAMLLLFAIFNTMIGIIHRKNLNYFIISFLVFIALVGLGYTVSFWLSGVALSEAGSIGWILIIFLFCFMVLISLVNLMRVILMIIEKKDREHLNK